MQYATIHDKTIEYNIQGSSKGEHVILIHGSIFADMYLPLMSQPILADNYSMVIYHRQGLAGISHNLSVTTRLEDDESDFNFLGRSYLLIIWRRRKSFLPLLVRIAS